MEVSVDPEKRSDMSDACGFELIVRDCENGLKGGDWCSMGVCGVRGYLFLFLGSEIMK